MARREEVCPHRRVQLMASGEVVHAAAAIVAEGEKAEQANTSPPQHLDQEREERENICYSAHPQQGLGEVARYSY